MSDLAKYEVKPSNDLDKYEVKSAKDYLDELDKPEPEAGIGTKLAGFVEGIPGGALLTREAGALGAAAGHLAGGGELEDVPAIMTQGYKETGNDIKDYTEKHPVISTMENLASGAASGGALSKGAQEIIGSGLMGEILSVGGTEGLGSFVNSKARGDSTEDALKAAGLSAALSGASTGIISKGRGLLRKGAGISEEAEQAYKAEPELTKKITSSDAQSAIRSNLEEVQKDLRDKTSQVIDTFKTTDKKIDTQPIINKIEDIKKDFQYSNGLAKSKADESKIAELGDYAERLSKLDSPADIYAFKNSIQRQLEDSGYYKDTGKVNMYLGRLDAIAGEAESQLENQMAEQGIPQIKELMGSTRQVRGILDQVSSKPGEALSASNRKALKQLEEISGKDYTKEIDALRARQQLGLDKPMDKSKAAMSIGKAAITGRIGPILKTAATIMNGPKRAYLIGSDMLDSPALEAFKPEIEAAMKSGPRALVGTMYMIQQKDPSKTDEIEKILNRYEKGQ